MLAEYCWNKKKINEWVNKNGLESFVDDRLWKIEWKSIGAGLYKVRFRCLAAWNKDNCPIRDVVNNTYLGRQLEEF